MFWCTSAIINCTSAITSCTSATISCVSVILSCTSAIIRCTSALISCVSAIISFLLLPWSVVLMPWSAVLCHERSWSLKSFSWTETLTQTFWLPVFSLFVQEPWARGDVLWVVLQGTESGVSMFYRRGHGYLWRGSVLLYVVFSACVFCWTGAYGCGDVCSSNSIVSAGSLDLLWGNGKYPTLKICSLCGVEKIMWPCILLLTKNDNRKNQADSTIPLWFSLSSCLKCCVN